MRLQKSIIALFALFFFAATANAQFGDLLNKAKNKVDKATKKTNTNTSVTPNGGAAQNDNPGRGLQIGDPNTVGISKTPVDPKNLRATNFINEFKAGEPIYGIVFFTKNLSEYARPVPFKEGKMRIPVSMNGGLTPSALGQEIHDASISGGVVEISVTPAMMSQNYATFTIFPDVSKSVSEDEATSGYFFLENLVKPNGGKKLYMQISFSDYQDRPGFAPIVIDLTGGNQAYLSKAGAIEKARAGNLNKEAASNEIPKAGSMKNSALEKQIAALMNKEFNVQLLKIIITWDDWQPVYHNVTGALIARTLETRNLVKEEGNCKVKSLQVFQDKTGAGYGKIYINGIGRTDDYIVPCEKVK